MTVGGGRSFARAANRLKALYIFSDEFQVGSTRPLAAFVDFDGVFQLRWSRCERCGSPWPAMFMVPDRVWRHYILSLGDGEKMLCLDCFKLIVRLTDGGRYMRKHGEPRMLRE
jgi:hypothetical protein